MEPLLILHAVAAMCAPALVRVMGRGAFTVLAAVPALALVFTAGRVPYEHTRAWAPQLGLELAFRVDELSALMVTLVTGIGALVLWYCSRYFGPDAQGLGRFAGVLVAFAGAMLGLVVADDLLLLYVFWELTTVFSYLLIGYDPESRASRVAAMQALTVTTLGGLAMLAGLVIIGQAAGTYRISRIVADPPQGGMVVTALVLVLAGALAKSAIFPFSLWLPGAMAAPTPVSAYLHAAAMVKAGIYLLARLGPAFGDVAVWRLVAVPLGLATMLMAGWRALRETDLKRLLAYGTVSQLGFLTVLFGAGTGAAALAGVAMLLAHALFKAALFLVVGIVDHATGTRDLTVLSGLRTTMPWVCAASVLAAASMAGLPPLLGFAGKEAAFESLLHDPLVLAGVVLGSLLTVAYTARFLWGAFAAKPGLPPTPVRPTPAPMFTPPALLSVLGLATAFTASWYGAAMTPYTATYPDHGPEVHLALWSGALTPLALSAVALAGGIALFLIREPVARLGASLHVLDAAQLYWAFMRGVDRNATILTGLLQRGSLPAYLTLALAVMAATGCFSFLYGGAPVLDLDVTAWARPEQPVIGAVLVAGAVALLFVRGHILLALMAGVTGYGAALLFLVHGSPDLALTQFLAETLSLVMFALVLRRLPVSPERDSARVPFGLRLGLGLVTGVVAAGAGMVALHERTAVPVGTQLAAAAERAGATNIVSALLVDIRAWDTLGESSVIIVLTLGVTSLVFLRRRTFSLEREDAAPLLDGRTHWLSATLPAGQRSVIFEIVARLTFHTMLLLSVFLLLTGHGRVGGGFAGGIVAGLAVAVRYLAGGRYELARALPVNAGVLIGVGLTLSVCCALIGWGAGGDALRMLAADVTLPLVGTLHLSTVLLFDFGIYLSVVGMVGDVLRSLGAELDRQMEGP
ncbi:Na+/H+ antiporter subunit A [Nonomuraea endophytica]|uniref:Multicomponent Na+:H+ antiporter subunit A n=1 Tax=Nonomuraea endophytica TaxID=714136 RepID=A0A7W8A2H0_9ACTN|nr:Na+/H+ antiporter subunit A [Nonomuraea endophytica]MBB5078283.1 multicomponent Na+:H+ antiporter subunit A [Nonomuraea endophytica]